MGIGTALAIIAVGVAVLWGAVCALKDAPTQIKIVIGGIGLTLALLGTRGIINYVQFHMDYRGVDTRSETPAPVIDTQLSETPEIRIKPTVDEQRDAFKEPGLSQ